MDLVSQFVARQAKPILMNRADLIPWVTAIQYGFISFLLTSIFLHEGYSRYMWLMIALVASCSVLTQALLRQER